MPRWLIAMLVVDAVFGLVKYARNRNHFTNVRDKVHLDAAASWPYVPSSVLLAVAKLLAVGVVCFVLIGS